MTFSVDGKGACLIDGVSYNAIGFGTYRLKGDNCFHAVTEAARCGYRIIDTATYYENFIPLGKALNQFDRKSFYIISKVWPDDQPPKLMRQDLQKTLKELNTDYIDAYLLHWPDSRLPLKEILGAMLELQQKGLIRHIGLSNVTVNHLKRALEFNVPLRWVQIEMHPLFYDRNLLEFCKNKGILVQAWAPLATGRVNSDPLLQKIAEKLNRLPSQIALRWIVQQGAIPLPSSHSSLHLKQNLECLDFELPQNEMDEISKQAEKGSRKRITKEAGFGFTDEFDFSYQQCWPLA